MSKEQKTVFWIAGENSGDLHASMVIRRLRENGTELKHIGIGGHKMQIEGFTPLFPFKKFSVMGFGEVVGHLPFFLKTESRLKRMFVNLKPSLVVLVDYPGFNLRIAKIAHDMEIPVLYFICPQFWAWKHSRVHKLREFTNFVAAILPFEKQLLEIHRVHSSFVGHPIAEEIKIDVDRETFAQTFGLDLSKKWIGFMPGSRDIEMARLLPEFISAIRKFATDDYNFLISKTHTVNKEKFWQHIPRDENLNIYVIDGYIYEMIKYSDFMAVTSGTATLETAYIGTPFLIVYKTSKLSYSIGRRLIKLKWIGLPNIIMEKNLIPELIQDDVTGDSIHKEITKYLSSPAEYRSVSEDLKELRALLGEKSTSKEVAAIIEEMTASSEV